MYDAVGIVFVFPLEWWDAVHCVWDIFWTDLGQLGEEIIKQKIAREMKMVMSQNRMSGCWRHHSSERTGWRF